MSKQHTDKARRDFLKTATGATVIAATGSLSAPAIAQSRSIRVGAYGGYFEDSFKKHVYPAFTEATGIAIESITQPDSTSWLQTMKQAQDAGTLPTDISMHTPLNLLKGDAIGGQFQTLDASKIPNLSNLDEYFHFNSKGELQGVGVLSFFQSLVYNTNEIDNIESWSELWDTERFEASLGIQDNATVLDVVAATFFGGVDALKTREGITAAIEKAAELHPNVALWYDAESQMEQSLKNFDVVAGSYFHDVASLMAADGLPIKSIFPKEGAVLDFNSWTLAPGSDKSDEAHEFINFTCEPSTQALMSRMIGTAPVVDQSQTDLTDEEFASVSGTPAIKPDPSIYLEHETFINESWAKMVAKA